MRYQFTPEEIARFWSRVDRRSENECWNWTGGTKKNGYGQIGFNRLGGPISAHRMSYILAHGDIPDGMSVCHRCDNRLCVNPNHLFLGTQLDNMRDAKRKRRNYQSEHTAKSRKLTDEQVRQIRLRYAAGESSPNLAREFGVCQSNITLIAGGKSRRSAGGPITRRGRGRRFT